MTPRALLTQPSPQSPRPRRARRAWIAGALAVTLSVGGGTAWALDRYVIEHVEIADVDADAGRDEDRTTPGVTATAGVPTYSGSSQGAPMLPPVPATSVRS